MNTNMKKEIVQMRKVILELIYKANEGHLPSSYSVLEIIYYLYTSGRISYKENNKGHFILSKGHAALALYAVLYQVGIINKKDLYTYCEEGSLYAGHPNHKIEGISYSTGSLGHGINYAVGLCLGLRALGVNDKIYCLLGDGEINEGTVWESLLIINQLHLKNLIIIIDNNQSTNRCLTVNNMEQKFKSFGFNVSACDGNNLNRLNDAFELLPEDKNSIVIANTIKGYGLKKIMNSYEWHHKMPSTSEYHEFLNELDNTLL